MIAEYRLRAAVKDCEPHDPPSAIEFGERFVQFPMSKSKHFRADITPWLREPFERAEDSETRIVTLVKPVQTGGSAFGEVMLCKWIMYGRGIVQYNWPNEDKCKDRWESRIEGILRACKPIADRVALLPQNEATKREIDFGKVFFRMQGVFVPGALDSDTVRLQINEEVHDWKPGHLAKARNRLTDVWDFKSFDISNAGRVGDQLFEAFRSGTQQWWINKCPGCGLYHKMKTRWDDKRPDLGGLRYDASKARLPGGYYNYNIVAATIRFQMPCGFVVRDDAIERRELSDCAKYSEPENAGADGAHRSYSYEAVTVHSIRWLDLIKDKHNALRALRQGDPAPWIKYRTERECIFYDSDDNPIDGGFVVLQTEQKKNRDGIPGNKVRLFSLDRQAGIAKRGELPYWKLVIRDVTIDSETRRLRTLLVFEGRLETDEQVIAVLEDHKCNRWQGCADSGDDTEHVYIFCLRYGINAVKGGKDQMYSHPNGARRVYSPERPLHAMLNRPPNYPYMMLGGKKTPDPREPLFWLYSKFGIRERFHWLRTSTQFETPGDVSDEYQNELASEEREERRHPTTQEKIFDWVQKRKKNDYFVCECYIAMQIDQAGMILDRLDIAEKPTSETGEGWKQKTE